MINISIVVPVHNKEQYMQATLNSVLAQTYPHFELILVDDGSSDTSGDICEEYALADQRISVYHQANAGVSAARNAGIRRALHDYIAFIDADDYWESNYLEEMISLMERYPDVSIYASQFARISEGEKREPEIIVHNPDKYILFDLIRVSCNKARLPINASSVIIKKVAIIRAGYFDERIYMFEDYDFFLRIALFSKVAFLNGNALSYYNLDVPAETKIRGKVPLLNKNWVSYMDKFDVFLSDNEYLATLLTSAKLKQLLFYRHYPEYKEQVKQLKGTLDRRLLSIPYRIALISPPFLSDCYVRLNLFLHKIKKCLCRKI